MGFVTTRVMRPRTRPASEVNETWSPRFSRSLLLDGLDSFGLRLATVLATVLDPSARRILRAVVATRPIPEPRSRHGWSITGQRWRCHAPAPGRATLPPRSDGQRAAPFADERRRRLHGGRPLSPGARWTQQTGDRQRHATAPRCVVGLG